MKRHLKNLLWFLAMMVSMSASAQDWKDVTSTYLPSTSFENGLDGWSSYNVNAQNGCAVSTSENFFFGFFTQFLPAGNYRLCFNGFQRMGSAELAWSKHKNGNEPMFGEISIYHDNMSSSQWVKCVYDFDTYSESDIADISTKPGKWQLVEGKYYPSDVAAAKECFDNNMYSNIVEFHKDEAGYLSFYIEAAGMSNSCLTVLSNFRLYREGDMKLPESVEIATHELSICPAELCNLTAKIMPEDTAYPNVWWETSDPSIVRVYGDGTLLGVSAGECIITARAINPEGYGSDEIFAQCKVSVVAPNGKASDLIANEIMVSNVSEVMDPSYNYGSWIELYNPSNEKVLLGGLYISNDANNLHKCKLSLDYGVLRPGEFRTLWFDHYGIWNTGELNQINFGLNYNGGTIYLSDENEMLCQIDYPEAVSRTSYARTKDGGDTWGLTATPTPGASNNSSVFATEKAEAPVFSREGGVYTDEEFEVMMIADGATIYLTVDGSTPTENNYRYTAKDTLSLNWPSGVNNVNLRCRAYKEGMLPSDVVTRTFIRDKGYTLPIIAVTGDFDDLYGEDYGILYTGDGWNGRPGNGQVYPRNYNMDWDRPVNFEYITEKGEHVVSQEVNMAKCGGWSRAYMPHAFKLKAAKHMMGQSTIDYPFFKNKPYLKNKTLQIRQGGNDNVSRIKDAALQQVVLRSGLYVDAQESQPVHVFINTQYQGTMNMREPNNKHFAYANYGIDTDEMDQFEMSPDSGYVQKEGTSEAFLRWYDLSADAESNDVYEEIKKLVDIDEYINYMAVEFYLGNKDWPQNNIKGFRDRNDGKFHFVLFDLDQAFETSDASVFTTFSNKKTHTFDTLLGYDALDNYIEGEKITEEIKMVTIFLNMLKNEAFRKRFIDTYCIVTGSVFAPSRVKEIVNEVRDKMLEARKAMDPDWRARSYDNDSWYNPSTSASKITSTITTTRNGNMITAMKNYAAFGLKSVSAKAMKLSANVEGAKVYINDIEVPTGEFDGKVFRPVTFSTKAPEGYRFRGWTKSTNKFLTPDELEYVTTETTYELPDGTAPSSLRAIFEPMSREEMIASKMRPVMVNEVCAKNGMAVNDYGKKSDWIELYNTTGQDVNIAGLYITDNINKAQKYQIPVDDPTINTIIPAHGYKVVWTDKQDNKSEQLHAGFKLDADGGLVMITADPSVADKSLFNETFDSEWTDTLAYAAMEKGTTLGRYPDGSQSTYLLTTPSIGKANQLSMYSAPLWISPIEVGIHAVAVEGCEGMGTTEIYSISGMRTSKMQKGMNIVKYSNGTVKKVLVK